MMVKPPLLLNISVFIIQKIRKFVQFLCQKNEYFETQGLKNERNPALVLEMNGNNYYKSWKHDKVIIVNHQKLCYTE
jgi:hypothetical protein